MLTPRMRRINSDFLDFRYGLLLNTDNVYVYNICGSQFDEQSEKKKVKQNMNIEHHMQREIRSWIS